MKRWIIVIVALLLVIGGLVGVKAMQIGAMMDAGKNFQMPPESVTTAQAKEGDWQPTMAAVGSLVAVQAVTISSELAGSVKYVGFESGAAVKKGQVLVRLDTSMEEAQLTAASAAAKLADLNYQRSKKLRESNANTQAELDAVDALNLQAIAAVKNIEVLISKKTITAPFSGRVGIRTVELGQVLAPGTPLTMLQSTDPIYAEFFLPQQSLATVTEGQAARMRTDTFAGQNWDGKVTMINSEIDVATRNVRLRATFANPEAKLRPGMFVNVEVLASEKQKILNVPATAVMYAPYGDSVFVVEEKKDEATGKSSKVVRQKFVRLGERHGDFVSVVSGLEPNESVVTSGAFKLRNGAAVVENNNLAPNIQAKPDPEDS